MLSIYQKSHFSGVKSAVILALCLCLFSCKKDDDDNYQMDNQTFVTRASSSNNFEVAAGALAQTKGQNAAVKHYGEHMVTDHTAAGLEMKALADRKGLATMPMGNLLESHQLNLNILAQATGSDFDKKFAQIMVQSHQEAVSLFEIASSEDGVPDVELRAMATQKLPTLKTHLQQALTLQATVNQ